MATKPKKGKPSSQKKEAITAKPWPEIPQQLACLFFRQWKLMKNISYGGVTKSWIASPRRCNPLGKLRWPQLYDTKDRNGNNFHGKPHPHVFNIKFDVGYYWVRPPQRPLLHVIGYSRGEVIGRRDLVSNNFYFHEPITRSYRISPPWDTNVPYKCATQSSSSGKYGSNIVMVLTGISKPAFMFSRRGGYGNYDWIRCDCTIFDPYDSTPQFMKFTNVVEFKGKFYALSLQGSLAVIEEIDSQLRITALGANRAVPTVFSKRFREHLFESNGEVLLVFLISRKSNEIVDDVEVFRLRFGRLAWEKIENLGDRTLFVGATSCVCVSSSKVGCISNCIYFTQITVDGWWVFDMEKGNISPGWTESDSTTKSPVWDVPIEDEKKLSFAGYFFQ